MADSRCQALSCPAGGLAMSIRLATGGRRIDRTQPLEFRFNGKRFRGFVGDTLASALLANNQRLVGRSFKYHRPRGIVATGPEEPNGLVTVSAGGSTRPNQRATQCQVAEGMVVRSQNHWPTLEFDIGEIADLAAPLLPAAFYYKTFIWPRPAWKALFEPVIRQAAGLGAASLDRDPAHYEHYYAHVDVLIIGAGLSGLTAARALAPTGLQILVLEQDLQAGGRLVKDRTEIGERPSLEWLSDQLHHLDGYQNVSIRMRTMAAGHYDHGLVLADESLPGERGVVHHRLWRIRAKHIILATGAIERPLAFVGNDRPGVMLASAVRDYVADYGVSPGDSTVVVTNNDDAYMTALTLLDAGLTVPAILDTRPASEGELPLMAQQRGIDVRYNQAVTSVHGRMGVKAVSVCAQVGEGVESGTIACECLAMSGGWSPSFHLWSHCGGQAEWDEAGLQFRPDLNAPAITDAGTQAIFPTGSCNGIHAAESIIADAWEAARRLAESQGAAVDGSADETISSLIESPPEPAWLVPQGMKDTRKAKVWIDFQNDVKVSDIELAVREGFESPEHAKRYTTLGMATDQGKTSGITGVALLARARNCSMDAIATTTFRPPYCPIPLGSIVGQARGDLFLPTRKTCLDAWQQANGAVWEPVAAWRKPYAYLQAGESEHDAIRREVRRVRSTVGIFDASTLGKLLVVGPDAGLFLDRIYTGRISTIPVGCCRYGLMCNEDGFLIDDGVVARLGEDRFLCHTTTGGADFIHGWMEEWLQTEWWDLRLYCTNLTEESAQIVVAGPDARSLLQGLTDVDLARDSFPFLAWREGKVAGCPARVYRISFSGELSFEIAVPATMGMTLWNALLSVGQDYAIEPYGTEAMHVLRAEKGYIMIGDETDGTVTPDDLGLGWAVDNAKADFVGKRGMMRAPFARDDRWQLVGLESLDAKTTLPDGACAIANTPGPFGHRQSIGRVTS
ncbi:MAG: 2Fe-2S iron-sulfur cluster-binding protein, partial [Rhodobacteraceae bacterium]|nr:2Fe-2S iron-sulfur cluster-binding protein [Paracoccaceae bacterium]